MTQTAEKPIELTHDSFRKQFIGKYPELGETFDKVKLKLDRGEGTQDLANLIDRELDFREEVTAYIYSWTGPNGHKFVYRVLKPFDPKPERKPEATQEPPKQPETQPALQESAQTPDEPETDAQEPAEAVGAPDETHESVEEPKPAKPAPETPVPSAGLFSALATLIGQTTLLMTLAKHDDDLTVNVVPFGDDKDSSVSAICLTGTPAELDASFAEAIAVKVAGRKSLAEQIEALKAAEKELADAKKAEADAKKAETAKKTKAAEAKKKEEEEKKQEEEKEAERAKSQEALF